MDKKIRNYWILTNILLVLTYAWTVWGLRTFSDYIDGINSCFE